MESYIYLLTDSNLKHSTFGMLSANNVNVFGTWLELYSVQFSILCHLHQLANIWGSVLCPLSIHLSACSSHFLVLCWAGDTCSLKCFCFHLSGQPGLGERKFLAVAILEQQNVG